MIPASGNWIPSDTQRNSRTIRGGDLLPIGRIVNNRLPAAAQPGLLQVRPHL